MQIHRLFEIIYLLLEKDRIPAGELAQRFEVSTRTIYRDIETLSESGIPVYMVRGKGGGISLTPGFTLNKAVLTEQEKTQLLSSLFALNSVSPDESGAALKKLGSLLGEGNADWIEIDFLNWGDSQKEKERFLQLKKAILERRVVVFQYANARGEVMQRTVEPIKLYFRGGSWYLYGYCLRREDMRFFKLRRIQQLRVETKKSTHILEKAALQPLYPLSDTTDAATVDIMLKIGKEMAFRVYDEFDEYLALPNGDFIVHMRASVGDWLLPYFVSFGAHCQIIAPEEVKQRMYDELENITAQYR